MKSFRRIAFLILSLCLGYACSTSRKSTEDGSKPRKTPVTGVKPAITNPSRGVINASGDALTPGIGQTNGAGSEENANNIVNNAISKANDLVKMSAMNIDSIREIDFMRTITSTQAIELRLSKQALEKSGNKKIKNFAAMIVTDHPQMQNDLKQLSNGKSVLLLAGQAKKVQGTENNFDFEYVQTMITSSQKNISFFERASRSKNSGIKAFALKQLPVLKKHLSAAQELTSEVRPGKGAN